MELITRDQYLNSPVRNEQGSYDPTLGMIAHRRYYSQFVNNSTINYVVHHIGADTILNSTDKHFNDIPMNKWDKLINGLPLAINMRDVGDYYTNAGGVCIAKEAARQYCERQAELS